MSKNPFFKDSALKDVPSKIKASKFKLKEEFRNSVITLKQEGDNFIAAFENSNGKFAKGATKSMAVGNLIMQNSEAIE